MMKHYCPFAFLLFVGCSSGIMEVKTAFDGLTVIVRLPHNTVATSGSVDRVLSGKFGGHEYTIDHHRVTLDGRDYGTVRAGDRVVIEPGRVLVNDEPRPPQKGP